MAPPPPPLRGHLPHQADCYLPQLQQGYRHCHRHRHRRRRRRHRRRHHRRCVAICHTKLMAICHSCSRGTTAAGIHLRTTIAGAASGYLLMGSRGTNTAAHASPPPPPHVRLLANGEHGHPPAPQRGPPKPQPNSGTGKQEDIDGIVAAWQLATAITATLRVSVTQRSGSCWSRSNRLKPRRTRAVARGVGTRTARLRTSGSVAPSFRHGYYRDAAGKRYPKECLLLESLQPL